MEIAVDFDGTCVTHDYPFIGKDIGSVKVLKELVTNGHKLILYTMRSGGELEDAVTWFAVNGIELYGVQKNPTQEKWTTSNKCYAQLYIDDAALGCPLDFDANKSARDFVDWSKVYDLLIAKGLITDKYTPLRDKFNEGDYVFGLGEAKGCSPIFDLYTAQPQPFSYLSATNPDDFRLATDEERSEADASFNKNSGDSNE